jgi:uncharacterized protein YvpB
MMKLLKRRWWIAGVLGAVIVAGAGGIVVAQALREGPSSAQIASVPLIQQQHHLSCEYAAASTVTRFWGRPVTEDDFIRAIPLDPNPHVGYRGNIDAGWGGIDNYGIYAEPLVPVLEAQGYRAAVFYGPPQRLKAEIAAGRPVVVWIAGVPGRLTSQVETTAGRQFSLTPFEHALVVTGYDSTQVSVMDVAHGTNSAFAWPDFLQRWSYFDEMALAISPR